MRVSLLIAVLCSFAVAAYGAGNCSITIGGKFIDLIPFGALKNESVLTD